MAQTRNKRLLDFVSKIDEYWFIPLGENFVIHEDTLLLLDATKLRTYKDHLKEALRHCESVSDSLIVLASRLGVVDHAGMNVILQILERERGNIEDLLRSLREEHFGQQGREKLGELYQVIGAIKTLLAQIKTALASADAAGVAVSA